MANWWDKNLTDKQKFRLQEPKDPSLLDVVSTVPNPVGDVASGLLAAQDFSKGNYGTAALNSLGLLPFIPSMGAVVKNIGKDTPVSAIEEYAMYHRPPMKGSGAPLNDLTGGGDYYPDDIYSPMARQYYGTGEPALDKETISIINQYKDKPNAMVTMYRAVPDFNKQVNSEIKQLNKLASYKNQFGFFPIGDKTYDAIRNKYPVSDNLTYNQQQENVLNDINEKIAELTGQVKPLPNINTGDWVTVNKRYAKEHGEAALGGNYKILSKKVPAKKLFTNADSIHEFGYDETGKATPELLAYIAGGGLLGTGAYKANQDKPKKTK
jgi:hypothetical protein